MYKYMREEALYNFFWYCSQYIKMNKFLKLANIKHSNFSDYLKYKNFGAVESYKLNDLYFQIVYFMDSASKL